MKVVETPASYSSEVPKSEGQGSPEPANSVSVVSSRSPKEPSTAQKSDASHAPDLRLGSVSALLECNEAMSLDSLHHFEADTCEPAKFREDSEPQPAEARDDSSSHRRGSVNSLLPAARASPSLAPTDSYSPRK